MQKIIGTGLSGLVGSRIVELLKDKFEFVDFSLDTGVNILDAANLSAAFSQNSDAIAVLHLAAFTDTNAAWEQRNNKDGLCYQLNVVGTQNILELAQKYNQQLIYISTDFVFDGTKSTPYLETDIPTPIEWYGETKYLGEKVITDSDYNNYNISRITYPYRSDFETKVDIIRKVIAKLKNKEEVKMFSDQICTYTFIDDIAAALAYFIDHKTTGIYHLVGSSSHSPYDMCLKVAEVFGFDKNLISASSLDEFIKSQPEGSRPWQKTLITSNEKVKSLGLNFKTLAEGLEEIKNQTNYGR
ncbi:MAG: sugar nucleotide-binding protein [Candidatus Shapirobacteria bacterium]|nr:sugar nucleotide-binding protein [Candidatus Shapirobacteria bacterium]MDD4410716.1 sugar nucleotide-binding protein [Candidatus Shapirobacteria bacterium]